MEVLFYIGNNTSIEPNMTCIQGANSTNNSEWVIGLTYFNAYSIGNTSPEILFFGCVACLEFKMEFNSYLL
jgi:hypothetical protein